MNFDNAFQRVVLQEVAKDSLISLLRSDREAQTIVQIPTDIQQDQV